MRSEKTIRETIKTYRGAANAADNEQVALLFTQKAAALEWALQDEPEEPLTTIELKELREIMRERKESVRREAIKQGYSQAGQEYAQAGGSSAPGGNGFGNNRSMCWSGE